MARESGPSFEQRLADAGLTPQQRETGSAVLLVARLVHEMIELLGAQNNLLEQIRDGRASAVTNVHNGGPADDPEGSSDVQLREPLVPPADPDNEPDAGTGPEKTTARKPAKRTARTATDKPTKTAPAARRGGKSGGQ